MSWFSVMRKGKGVLDSHSFFDSALTGQFIGRYAVSYLLNNNPTYVKTRERAAFYFSLKCYPQLHPISVAITEKLLDKIKRNHQSSRLFTKIAKNALTTALEPFCKKVIKKGMKIFVRKQIENLIDALCEKGISLIAIASIYQIAIAALSAPFFDENPYLKPTTEWIHQYVPSPATLLSTLTAAHLAEMVRVIWNTRNLKHETDKAEVKNLVVDQIIHPIKETLENKRLYKILRLALNEEKIDALISYLIHELIDQYYWENMHQVRFLHLPLVS